MKEANKMFSEFPWFNFITSMLSILALGISIWCLYYAWEANQISREANKISSESLEFSKKTDAEVRRPRLQMAVPSRPDGVIIQYKKDNDQPQFLIQIEVKNVGQIPATNITCLRDLIKKAEVFGKEIEGIDSTSNDSPISRGPDQHFVHTKIAVLTSTNPAQLDEVIKEFMAGKFFITMDIAFKYTDKATLKEYTVSAVYKINRTVATILEYSED